ncbi:MAG: cbb3-type cytochrome c oxidase subunit I, partial [Halobacteriales archaeon]
MAYLDEYPFEARIVRYNFLVAFAALGVGGLFGLIQALHRTNVLRIIPSADYYTILTGHGVLLALVFTTFFIAGLFTWGISRSLERPLANTTLTWTWFSLMVIGTVLAAIAILGGIIGQIPFNADVLFTFYAPMKAHPIFYIGAALIIVGSWIAGVNYFLTYWQWRKENPDSRIPLQTFMVLTTMLMWYLSSIGVAVEVVVFLIPWSLGLISQVDPLFTRTLFWYFGHPVVYFWLLPAYLIWYTILPKLAGGRLFSDPLARVVFVLFLLLSTPTGFHHQYVDPGIPEGFKFIAMTNTMFLLLPSLLTAFTVVASMEHGARQRGGEGRLAWLRSLPWDEPAFAGITLAGLMFAAGGFSGMINAGMNINYLIHNT